MANAQGRKRLVVCCDGTWNDMDGGRAETNVAILARAVRASSGDLPQQTFYLRGIGSTGFTLQRVIDGATGNGMDEAIRSAYMFLAQNYVPGDEIFLFGFSRGAFTVRSLGGLVSACGLLKRQCLGRIQDAWTFYRTQTPRNPAAFRQRHPGIATHDDVLIRFLGVWDTVGALGIPTTLLSGLSMRAYAFHDTELSPRVQTARQALAIDELRDPFVPTFWTASNARKRAEDAERDIRQVWFAGAHGDVGGGYPERGLSNIALRWMAEEAMAAGLDLDTVDVLNDAFPGDPLAPQHDPREGWSLADRWTPTFRRVRETDVEVPLTQTLFVPRDRHDRVLLTINESLHESVLQRYGRSVRTIGGGKRNPAPYRPLNVPEHLLA